MLAEKKFYAVYIPESEKSGNGNNVQIHSDQSSVMKLCKDNKRARFRGFSTEDEAVRFSASGPQNNSVNPNCSVESSSFSKPTFKDRMAFRDYIERGDVETVKKLIWKNPHYLISEGDGITILKEGQRYNALHVAAYSRNAVIAEFILSTISDPAFTKLLYGVDINSSYLTRPNMLLDMILNTPEKQANETALHIASKYGAVDVVRVLVSYPQCNKELVNKFLQKPIDVICVRMTASADVIEQTRREILILLQDGYLVPVWRTDDNSAQPIVGNPFSPQTPPCSPHMGKSPLAPVRRIKAVAGPMSKEEAEEFHKEWKMSTRRVLQLSPSKLMTPSPLKTCSPLSSTPLGTSHARVPSTPLSTPRTRNPSTPLSTPRARDPLDMEKGLEKVGRRLASKYRVSWKEYWSFLDMFVDFRTEEGLQILENFLKNKILSLSEKKKLKGQNAEENTAKTEGLINKIYDVCGLVKSFALSPLKNSPDVSLAKASQTIRLLALEKMSENLCEKAVVMLSNQFGRNAPIEDCSQKLLSEVYKFCIKIKEDYARYEDMLETLKKLHLRVGYLLANNMMKKFGPNYLQYSKLVFDLIANSDTEKLVNTYVKSFDYDNLKTAVIALKCINGHAAHYIDAKTNDVVRITDAETCNRIWSCTGNCSCYPCSLPSSPVSTKNLSSAVSTKTLSKNCSAKRRITFVLKEGEKKGGNSHSNSSDKLPQNSNRKIEKKNNICEEDTDDSDDEDRLFATPPSSTAESDDEMNDAEEGPEVFIEGNAATKLDAAVKDALEDVIITPDKYPSIYRWRHNVELYNTRNPYWKSPRNPNWRRGAALNYSNVFSPNT